MSEQIVTLAEALPREQARVREVLSQYESLRGMPNVMVEPAIFMIKAALSRAEKASSSGDVVEMLRCYEDLKGITG